MVWLVAQTVTLPDGSTEQVLVPQLYAVVREDDLTNTGTIMGNMAGCSLVSVAADNIHNLGGRISGSDVTAQAATDLNNIGGQISASLLASAGRDINLKTTTRSGS